MARTSSSSHMSEPSARNWYLHRLYLRSELKECLRVIEGVLREHQGLSEYPLYVKALILRQSGRIQESLQLFQAAACLNPENKENLKQVGRSLYLLGKHTAAIEVYEEILTMGRVDDWEIYHSIGLCHMYLKDYDRAAQNFQRANTINRHDATFLQLGKVHTLREDFKAAINVYLEALEFSPENPEILTTLGLLYLRVGENFRAFDYLGNSLTHDPRNPKTILAAGSIIKTTATWTLPSSSTEWLQRKRPTRRSSGTTSACASSASSATWRPWPASSARCTWTRSSGSRRIT